MLLPLTEHILNFALIPHASVKSYGDSNKHLKNKYIKTASFMLIVKLQKSTNYTGEKQGVEKRIDVFKFCDAVMRLRKNCLFLPSSRCREWSHYLCTPHETVYYVSPTRYCGLMYQSRPNIGKHEIRLKF